jgi:hypothetical protein
MTQKRNERQRKSRRVLQESEAFWRNGSQAPLLLAAAEAEGYYGCV